MKRLPLWLAVLALLVLLLGSLAVEAATETLPETTPLVRSPYSGAPTADSVVISWMVVPSLPARLEVSPIAPGADLPAATRTFAVGAPTEDKDGQVDVLVDGLKPATAYVYRVLIQSGSEVAASPIGRFKTAPAPGQPITFAVLSDTQWQWEGTNRLAVIANAIAFDSARSGGFDFVLHAGDVVETPNAHYWPHWFASFEPTLLAAPFVPVLGNHEKNSISYYNAFSHPAGAGQNGERWWTLRWGDIVVVGLDTSVTRADRILEQQAYARAELAVPARWKFVIFHHPVFSSDAYYGGDYSYDLIYHPIFVETGVDMVFNGHAHNYERIERDGVVYLVLGGGGATPVALAATRVEDSVTATEGRNFYASVAVTPRNVSVSVVSVAEATETTFALTPGDLLDSFTLRAPEAVDAESPSAVETVASRPAKTGIHPEEAERVPDLMGSESAKTKTAEPGSSEPGVTLSPPAEEDVVEPAASDVSMAVMFGAAALAAAAALVALVIWAILHVGR
jgi:predicted phosphodiesterase